MSSIHMNFCSVMPPSVGPQHVFGRTWFQFGHTQAGKKIAKSSSCDSDKMELIFPITHCSTFTLSKVSNAGNIARTIMANFQARHSKIVRPRWLKRVPQNSKIQHAKLTLTLVRIVMILDFADTLLREVDQA